MVGVESIMNSRPLTPVTLELNPDGDELLSTKLSAVDEQTFPWRLSPI